MYEQVKLEGEDKWREGLDSSPYEIESQGEMISCEWCHVEYEEEQSNARNPETYCSPACRCLHMEYSEEGDDSALGEGEL